MVKRRLLHILVYPSHESEVEIRNVFYNLELIITLAVDSRVDLTLAVDSRVDSSRESTQKDMNS
jgi:hypothetical protein